MTIILNGTTGITSVNGSAAAPSVTGTDTDTGIVYGTNTLSLATGGTTAVTVDSSQNVGIGTTSPTKPLTVKAATADGVATRLFANGNEDVILDFFNAAGNTQKASVSSDINSALKFNTVNTERMRIDSSGNLLLSTANSSLTVGSASTQGSSFATVQSGTAFSFACKFINGNGAVGSITTNGSSTAFNTSSDYRLKESIAPMTGALDVLQQLKPVTYKWKVDGSDGQGFIAHELQEIVPDCVIGEKDAVDADGKPVYQGIDTSFLVATLTAAIQELKAEFDAYKATHP